MRHKFASFKFSWRWGERGGNAGPLPDKEFFNCLQKQEIFKLNVLNKVCLDDIRQHEMCPLNIK